MPFIPHTKADVAAMLQAINIDSIDTLFDEIPAELKIKSLENVPDGLNEMAMNRLMRERAAIDTANYCFIGAGAYEHHIPAAVWDIASRGEFMTAYTPYQAEASQGTLQLLYEYQTMLASLMGMEVSNASMYDGASALAEAMLMAIRCQAKHAQKRILVAGNIHPHYLQTARALITVQGIELITLPVNAQTGCIDPASLAEFESLQAAALVIAQPNFLGQLEAVDELTDWAHAHDMLVIANVNPIAMALFTEPGSWGLTGADIACGEGQPLGIPLASGGPYFGFFCTRKSLVRQMPGRLIGRTTDLDGKSGFALTLQAREQHIRRAKATSNICTNQGLAVTAATIFMSLLGEAGLRNIAIMAYERTQQLATLLRALPEISIAYEGTHFHEIVVNLPVPAAQVLIEMTKLGVQAGYDLSQSFAEKTHQLLVCVTETKTEADLQHYVNTLRTVLINIATLQHHKTGKKEAAC